MNLNIMCNANLFEVNYPNVFGAANVENINAFYATSKQTLLTIRLKITKRTYLLHTNFFE